MWNINKSDKSIMPHSSRHLALWTRIPIPGVKVYLTVQIHHRARLAPFKVLISRILRSAAYLSRRGVCKNIVNIHTLLANLFFFFCIVDVFDKTRFWCKSPIPVMTKQILKQLVLQWEVFHTTNLECTGQKLI